MYSGSFGVHKKSIYRAYHAAVGEIRLVPDGDSSTGVESAEARSDAVWIARTRHGRRAAASRRRPLEPTLRPQRHLLRTRVCTRYQRRIHVSTQYQGRIHSVES